MPFLEFTLVKLRFYDYKNNSILKTRVENEKDDGKMNGKKTRPLIGLFLLGAVLFNFPILSLFNLNIILLGMPLLYFYLFSVWFAIIILAMLATKTGSNDSRKNYSD